MVEAEEEYVEQLEILISCFLRPFKMAASSKSPPCTHEDINSIFLNAETVLFLHQIFLKGLTARMESWPTLVLGTSLGAQEPSRETTKATISIPHLGTIRLPKKNDTKKVVPSPPLLPTNQPGFSLRYRGFSVLLYVK